MLELFLTPGGPGHLIVAAIIAVGAVFVSVMYGVRDSRRGQDTDKWVFFGIMGPVFALVWPILVLIALAAAALAFVLSPVILLAVYVGRRIK